MSWMSELRLREVKQLAQGHTASKQNRSLTQVSVSQGKIAAGLALDAFLTGLTLVWKDLWFGVPQESSLCFALLSIFLSITQMKTYRHTL